jgi:hypothetical protein
VNTVGTVEALWRYPVKSMAGEQLAQAPVDVRGVLGDRLYAIRDTDGKLGGGSDTRRFRRMDGLLDFRAEYLPDLTPVITLPDGRTVRGDDEHVHWAVSDGLDRPGVTLVKESVISHFDEEPLHLVTTATMTWLDAQAPESAVDVRRVRPNLVIAADPTDGPEDSWVGHEVRIGAHLVIDVVDTVQLFPLPDDLTEPTEAFRAFADIVGPRFGVYARVAAPGRVKVGDEVVLA